MKDYIVILILLAVVVTAAIYIIRAKRKGQKCIGCSAGGSCPRCNGGCHPDKS